MERSGCCCWRFLIHLAGVHLERRLLTIGLMLGVGYLAILFLPQYGWIAAGVLTAIALIGASLHWRAV